MELPLDQNWRGRTTERFKKFSLQSKHLSLLPERQSLMVDRLTGTLTLVDWQQEQFLDSCDDLSDEQFSLLLTLLEQWPSYVPYEKLLGQLGIQLTVQDIDDLERIRVSERADESEEEQRQDEQARARLQPALRTLRDLLRDCKPCLWDLCLDVVAVMDCGPLLMRYQEDT